MALYCAMAWACGLGIAAAGWTLAALVGLDAVFRLFPWSYMLVKIVGGLYLSYLAYGIWKAAPQPVAEAEIPAGHAFRSGLLVNLSNPKSVLFAAAVLVAIFPPDMDNAHKLAIVGNHLGIEIVFYTMLAATMSRQAVRTRYFAMKLYLDRFAAAVLRGPKRPPAWCFIAGRRHHASATALRQADRTGTGA